MAQKGLHPADYRLGKGCFAELAWGRSQLVTTSSSSRCKRRSRVNRVPVQWKKIQVLASVGPPEARRVGTLPVQLDDQIENLTS